MVKNKRKSMINKKFKFSKKKCLHRSIDRESPEGSRLIKNLERYNYLPDSQTIDKMKYYLGPYNEIKGFRKYMELSPCVTKDDSALWDKVSRYILYNKEGMIKKYTNPVYMPLKDVEVEQDDKPEKPFKKYRSKISRIIMAKKKKIREERRRNLNRSV